MDSDSVASGERSGQEVPQEPAGHAPGKGFGWAELGVMALILVAGGLLRAAYLGELTREPDFDAPLLDPQFHDYWARALVSDDWTPPEGLTDPEIRSAPYGRPPAYPYFLAGVYALTQGSYVAARVVQMAIGLLSAVLLWLLARQLAGRAVGLVAGAGMALYWGLVYFEGELSSPVLEVAMVILFAHAAALWQARPTALRAGIAGLALGLFILLRPNALAFLPVLLVWMAWVLRRRGERKRLAAVAAVAFAATAMVIAPVAFRNYRASHEFYLTTYLGPVNLHIGNNEATDCVTPTIPELHELAGSRTWTCFDYPLIVRGIARKLGKESITYGEAGDYFKEQAWAYIRQHPGQTLGRMLKRAALFWGPREITSNKVTAYDKRFSPTLRFLPGFGVVLGLAVLGLVRLIADARRRVTGSEDGGDVRPLIEMAVLLALFAAVYSGTFLPFLVSCRFRIALIPILLLAGAYGLVSLAGVFRAYGPGRCGVWAAAGAGLVALAHVPLAAYEPELDYWHFLRGMAYLHAEEWDSAKEAFKQAIEAEGSFTASMPYAQLAAIAIAEKNGEEAIRWYTEGLEIDPSDAAMHTNLARILAELGRADEANRHYEQALAISPDNPKIHNNYALLLDAQGQAEGAVEHFEKAIELDPAFATARGNLVICLARQGEVDAALDTYAALRSMDRDDPELPYVLGKHLEELGKRQAAAALYQGLLKADSGDMRALLSLAELVEGEADAEVVTLSSADYVALGNYLIDQGRLDEAGERYEQALVADPYNPDAHFNLGALKAAQGDIEEALVSYHNALDLQPNDAGIANHIGMVLARQGDLEEAVSYFNLALTNDPDFVLAYNNLGNVLAAQGEYEEAEAQYRKVIELAPNDRACHYNLGRILTLQERFDEALEAYEEALKRYPDTAQVHANMGIVLQGQGNLAEAREQFLKALKANPQNPAARQGLEQVGE